MSDDESSDIENLFKKTMPWLGEEIGIKDLQSQNVVLPGLSLVEWMNMQQNPPLTNSTMQLDYLRSLPGPIIPNLAAADLTHQLGLQAQILLQNNPQLNAPRPPQEVQQLNILKLPVAVNQLGSINRPQQQQLDDINQLQRHNLTNQTLPQNQSHSNLLQPQILVQNQVQQQQQQIQHQAMLSQNQQQPQQQQSPGVGLNQQPNQMPVQLSHQANQHLQLSEHHVQLQLLQKIQQQQQSILSQPELRQPQLAQLQEQQKQLLEIPQQLPNSNPTSQQQAIPQHMTKNTQVIVSFSQPMQHQSHQKLLQQRVMLPELPILPPPSSTSLLSPSAGSLLVAGGSQSGITDDIPSCSTSPSTNNCSILPQSILNRTAQGIVTMDEMVQSTATIMSPGTLEVVTTSPNLAKDLQKTDMQRKPSIPISNSQIQGTKQTYPSAPQMDYLYTPSSGMSVCLSHTDGPLHSSLNPSEMLLRDLAHNDEVQADPRNNVLFGVHIDEPLGMPFTPDPLLSKSIGSERDFQNHLSGNILTNYSNSKEVPQELSSSVVSQSFGVPDMAFNPGVPVDPANDDVGFLKGGSWAPPPPQLQRMRTFTKVYKRGAVGRSIDITRYSGYDELKQDLARRFGIEGQLEDRQRIGWKLVYVDHEKDVLLVGDDPWEEFVNCVRCIKILSPQEVQQMSLDGDFGNAVLPNQACSSSDDGNALRAGQGDHNFGNLCAGL